MLWPLNFLRSVVSFFVTVLFLPITGKKKKNQKQNFLFISLIIKKELLMSIADCMNDDDGNNVMQ